MDAAAATLWLNPGVTDPKEMMMRGFARVFGRSSAKKAARVALASDRYPFGGYPRWEINDRWDTISRCEPLAPLLAEEKFCRQAAQASGQAPALPAQLRASLQFRHYLAVRDVFVRRAARGLASAAEGKRFAQALAVGRRAAREMWEFTRDLRVRGTNDKIVAQDAARLRAWQRGRPVFGGRWQLCYAVTNFAPALQLVGVEQRQPDGTWKMLQSCLVIEFQTRAAQPRGNIRREHAAPVDWDGDVGNPPRLRFALRGVGQVRIADARLTNGRQAWSPAGWPGSRSHVLGRPSPTRGLPPLDWAVNRAALPLRFNPTATGSRP